MRPIISISCVAILFISSALGAELRVLVYQKNGKGFVHDNIAASAGAIRDLGSRHGFAVDVTTNAAVFSEPNLKSYTAVIFANSNNEAFESEEQREAFQAFIRRGGGFVGIHSSTGSERHWPIFQQVQGAKFLRHAPMQEFTVRVVDPNDMSTAHLADRWMWTDECYFFTNLNLKIHVLLAADVTTLKDSKLASAPGAMVDGVYPLAWRLEFEGGRQFYTSLGHKIEHYSDPLFRQHLAGGILWVLGKTNVGDAAAKKL